MKIECLKEKLSKALSKTERVTGKNITLPVLSCVLLSVHDSILTIKATNLDLGIEVKLPVKMIEPGEVAVSGSVLNNYISNVIGDKNINLESGDGVLKVSTKHSESTIKTLPVDDFPTIPKVDAPPFSFPVLDLLKGFKHVMYAASVSTMRPVLSSVLVYPSDDFVIFAATDSFRLAEKRVKMKKHKEFDQILIPFKNIPEIIKSIEDIKDEVSIYLNKNQISFSHDDTYVTSRVIDGTFPDYLQLIPKDIKTEVTILKQDFISALRISNIFSDKFSQVSFNIIPEDKKFIITTKNIDVGESHTTLDSVVSGEPLSLSFNYKYIVDCFQSIESDSVSLSFSDSNRPMIVRGVGDKNFLYLVMPMNK